MTDPPIRSRQNRRVKDAVKLRDRRQRDKQGRFLIDGLRELERAVDAGAEVVEVFLCEPLCHGETCRRLLAKIGESSAEIVRVTNEVFEKLAFGDRMEGIVGVARIAAPTLDELDLPEKPLIAVLEGIEKPGNLGAVLRSADGAGVSALVVIGPGTDLYNPNAIRASLGTVFSVPVCVAEGAAALAWLRARRLPIYATRPAASLPYTRPDYREGAAIVLGSESSGLSPLWAADDVTPIRLPMLGVADSLNVSTTAAVLFYEALRQRTEPAER